MGEIGRDGFLGQPIARPIPEFSDRRREKNKKGGQKFSSLRLRAIQRVYRYVEKGWGVRLALTAAKSQQVQQKAEGRVSREEKTMSTSERGTWVPLCI